MHIYRVISFTGLIPSQFFVLVGHDAPSFLSFAHSSLRDMLICSWILGKFNDGHEEGCRHPTPAARSPP